MKHHYLFDEDMHYRTTPHISVIGVGGTGSQLLTGLSRMVVALQSLGMKAPTVSVYDPDTVSSANVGRQLFSPADVGQSKAHILVNRINQFFGLDWVAHHAVFESSSTYSSNIFVSCVDTRAARADIYESIRTKPSYWLDLGNSNHSGQAVLGNSNYARQTHPARKKYCLLPSIADLFPEMIDSSIHDTDDTPSCSLAEALVKQDLMVNQTVATHALELLWQLLRYKEISHHGFFFDTKQFSLQPLSVEPENWKRLIKQAKKYRKSSLAA